LKWLYHEVVENIYSITDTTLVHTLVSLVCRVNGGLVRFQLLQLWKN